VRRLTQFSLQCGVEMDTLSSQRLWTSSREFANASQLVAEKSKGGASSVAYYLIALSLEMSLKAFLRAKGYSLASLKKNLRHNLCSLLKAGKNEDLGKYTYITKEFEEAVRSINFFYEKRDLPYVTVGMKEYPDFSLLLTGAEGILGGTKELCRKQRRLHG
jgi:hypothetical protein